MIRQYKHPLIGLSRISVPIIYSRFSLYFYKERGAKPTNAR